MTNILFFSVFTEHTSHNRNAKKALRGLRPCRDWEGVFGGANTGFWYCKRLISGGL